MHILDNHVLPNGLGFANDPFGYSASAWHRLALAQTFAGYPVDLSKKPTSDDLKTPVLWLSQAHALSEAAGTVLRGRPNQNILPQATREMCDCQYCAVGLMLVGYSLEVCLKAMLIMKKGVAVYSVEEKQHHHHSLDKLSEFIPGLNDKDKAILQALSHFVRWAGRYPDPGPRFIKDAEEIFTISEKYQITASDLFDLAARVMAHSKQVASSM